MLAIPLVYTLSCADMRWDEHLSSILREKGFNEISAEENPNLTDIKVKVELLKNGKIELKSLEKFLPKSVNKTLYTNN